MMGQVLLLVFAVLLVGATSKNLPSYIETCKRDDPKFQECVKIKAQSGLAGLMNGDKKFQIPKLNPLELSFVDLQPGPNLNFTMNNLTITGLADTKFEEVNFDLQNRKAEFVVTIPKLEHDGFYKADGKILVLKIAGDGPMNIVFYNGRYHYKMEYSLEKKSDKEYVRINETDFDFKLEKATFKLDNLFGGDATLGKEMDKFLNENWEDVINDLGKPIAYTLKVVIDRIVSNIITAVSYDKVFPY